MADFIFKISPNIVLGSYTASRLGQLAREWGDKYMLILDPILKEHGFVEKITQSLTENSIDFFVFDEIASTASSQTLEQILSLARNARVKGIIAAGGGRTLALAKAAAAMFYTKSTVYDVVDDQVALDQVLPLIVMPTTIRDAFIFTDKAPLTDGRTSKFKLLKTPNGVCRLVLWDPNLQVSLTEKQNNCMALEVLAYAIEGYLSQRSTFFSDMIIEKSLQLLTYALDGADSLSVTTPAEVLLTQGGCMASLGASASSFGAANLLSYAINSRFRVNRSLVTTILLPYVIEDGASFKANKLATVAKLLKAAPEDTSDADAVVLLQEYVRQKMAKANVPARLKDLGLTVEQLSRATEDAGELELMNFLPRSMTTDDLFELVKKAY